MLPEMSDLLREDKKREVSIWDKILTLENSKV